MELSTGERSGEVVALLVVFGLGVIVDGVGVRVHRGSWGVQARGEEEAVWRGGHGGRDESADCPKQRSRS